MRTFAEAASRHPLTFFGMKDPFVCAAIQRQVEHEEAMLRARATLGEPPRPGESDAEYLAREAAVLAYVPPEVSLECSNDAPVRGRYAVLPPGAVRWTERGAEAWRRVLPKLAASSAHVDRFTGARYQPRR